MFFVDWYDTKKENKKCKIIFPLEESKDNFVGIGACLFEAVSNKEWALF